MPTSHTVNRAEYKEAKKVQLDKVRKAIGAERGISKWWRESTLELYSEKETPTFYFAAVVNVRLSV